MNILKTSVNTWSMNILIDKIWIIISSMLGCLIVCTFARLSFWTSLLFAFIVGTSIALYLFSRKIGRKNTMRYEDFVTYLIVEGEDKLVSIVKCMDDSLSIDKKDNVYFFGSVPVFVWLKFGNISADSIVAMCKTCKKYNFSKAYVIASSKDKNALTLSKKLCQINLMFYDLKNIYKYAEKSNLIPKNIKYKGYYRQTFLFVLSTIFDSKNIKRYMLVSTILLVLSFLTPLTSYYLTLSSISLAFAIVCVIKNRCNLQNKSHHNN